MKFRMVAEKCTICGNYTIREVTLQYYNFDGLVVEQKKLCTSCNAVFDLKNNLQDVEWTQPTPKA